MVHFINKEKNELITVEKLMCVATKMDATHESLLKVSPPYLANEEYTRLINYHKNSKSTKKVTLPAKNVTLLAKTVHKQNENRQARGRGKK